MNVTTGLILVGTVLTGGVIFASSMFSENTSPIQTQSAFTFNDNSNAEANTLRKSQSYIIQSGNIDYIIDKIKTIGGEVANTYPVINAVNALLTDEQYASLNNTANLKIHPDVKMETQVFRGAIIDSRISSLLGADTVNKRHGLKGEGVTIAILDSGLNYGSAYTAHISEDANGNKIDVPKYNAFTRRDETRFQNNDWNGHGTHIAGIIGSSLVDNYGDYNGIAPSANLVSVKAFDTQGNSSYSVVLDGLNWIFKNHKKLNIKVLNLSIGAEVVSNYWNDPVNLAVMRLWDEGIVVVTSAGNAGKDKSIGVPGNNPYVITVGAVYDNETKTKDDDRLLSFSSRGPTYEGFIKPDIVAYGGAIPMRLDDKFTRALNGARIPGTNYFSASGTSQSAAVVSGIAALILQKDPGLSPDDVKCRLMDSATLAQNSERLTYSPFEQGAGMVSAADAYWSKATGCANQGLDIKKDLAGIEHFAGPVRETKNGEFVVVGGDGEVYTQGNHWGKNAMNVRGNHWGQSKMEVRGNHWGKKMIDLRGNHWGGTIMRLRSQDNQVMAINSIMTVNSNDKDVIPNASSIFNTWKLQYLSKKSSIATPLKLEDY